MHIPTLEYSESYPGKFSIEIINFFNKNPVVPFANLIWIVQKPADV